MSGVSVPALADSGSAGGGLGAAGQEAGPRRPGRWADLRTRVISAALLAPAALLCVWFDGWAWSILLLAAALGIGAEWSALCGQNSMRLARLAGPAYLVLAVAVVLSGHERAALLALVAGAGVTWALSRSIALSAGAAYVGVPLVALAWLRGLADTGRSDVLFVLVIVWASDIGAYAVGRFVGGPKLAPAISPGKTRSGAWGGLVSAMLVGEVAAPVLLPTIAPAGFGWAALVAGLLGVASQAGDLFESWIKRRFGVKDSGWLIPGHGGLLDRLDGLLAAAPAAAGLALFLGHGGALWH